MQPLSSTDTSTSAESHLRVVEQERGDMLAAARAMAQEMLQQERDRWAYEIHDGLTQTVAAAILQVEMLAHRVHRDPASAAEDLAETASEMRSAMADIRSILFSLSAGDQDPEPPTELLRSCVDEVAARWKLDASLDIHGDLLTVPRSVMAIALVVIHESLTNAAKHAGSPVSVRVEADPSGLRVLVADEGPGLGENAKRFGMRMMERRVHEAGGSLDVLSSDAGTYISATFPMGDSK
jgi:signal transduction histidine kinase